ncbi:MAG TPA: universal stress protein [Thermodesulfovibrionales bacterium]|nr:universal stress protein [Thermodesulfovibrionales bacterium]
MKILLPTDGSEYSETAVQFLKTLDLSRNDEITILHVIGDDAFQDKEDYYYSRIKEIKQTVAPKILDSALNILTSVPAVKNTLLMSGYPAECIVEAANVSNADLILMGPKRLKGIKSRIVGSVTKSVSIGSSKPVLVIKPRPGELLEDIKILLATDGTDYARRAGEVLSSIPFRTNTKVAILHVVTPAFYDVPDKFMEKIAESAREDLKKYRAVELRESREILERTAEHLSAQFSNIEKLTAMGEPSDEILYAANEMNASIIAVGSKGMGGFRGIVESLSRYILSAAECSVLIGKAKETS